MTVPGQQEPWGLIQLAPGDRWSAVVEAQGRVNLGLLSAAEQDQVEDAWQAVLRGVDFPLQICVQSRPVELPELVHAGAEGPLQIYAQAYAQHLGLWAGALVQVRRVFFVVPAEGELAVAVRTLERRVRQLAYGMERWVQLRVLDMSAALQVLATFWRQGQAPAAEAGMEPAPVVVGGVALAHVRAVAAEGRR